ncbi:MAG: succinate dehydrogenase, cytochrome b556 subunit [Alphaproteobacteria bacterium]|nr:succinate dehydrogenase, cytochrome b556 subunit [Alphaproteobacteria bacterium]
MAREATDNRPLSPHLQIYKPEYTSVLSITHRATGVALALGTLLLVWWLLAAAMGADAYATVQACLRSWFGRLLLFGWSWALFYHLANGIRHLFWDAGYGFELATAQKSGWAVVIAAAALTIVAWVVGLTARGG